MIFSNENINAQENALWAFFVVREFRYLEEIVFLSMNYVDLIELKVYSYIRDRVDLRI